MKNFNTLEELREALMSEDGAVYSTGGRFRLRCDSIELYLDRGKIWKNDHARRNHGFLWHLERWTRYEKPKKIVKESFEVFVNLENFDRHIVSPDLFGIYMSSSPDSLCNHKATITIEREVE